MVKRRALDGVPLRELKIAFDGPGVLGMRDDPVSQSFRATIQVLVPNVTFGLVNDA